MIDRRHVQSYLTSVLYLATSLPVLANEAPALSWSGLYIGGSSGVGVGGNSKSLDLDGFNYFCPNKPNCSSIAGEITDTGADSAFIGGAQIGFNYALTNRWVIGLEADLAAFDFSVSRTPASSKADWGADTLVMVEMSWLATVRGRVGYAADRWMIYATGGLALTDGRYRNYDFCDDIQAQCGSGLMDARGETTTGWTVGGGLEMAFTDNWTAKAEYLFMRFDGSLYTGTARFPEAGGGVETEDYRFSASPADLQLFRIGLNYKLGTPAR